MDEAPSEPQNFSLSESYSEEAGRLMPGAVNSNVRLAAYPVPLCFERGEGAHLFDVDGNRYVDYALGMGPTILGHAPKAVCDAVSMSLANGQLFAGQNRAELELAKLLNRHIPNAESVRIGMTGSEVVQAALRVSRAHTGKKKFIKFEGQYHGWYDNVLISVAPPANEPPDARTFERTPHLQTAGQTTSVLDDIIVLPWNDVDAVKATLEKRGHEIAAILTEPAMCNTGAIAPKEGFLSELRRLATSHDVVLIFDEVITGFRLALGGGQERFGVTPDLATFAKAMAGGFPVSALTGRDELMAHFGTGKVNHSGTYNANLPGVAAAIATIGELAANNAGLMKRADAVGRHLMNGIREIASKAGTDLKVQGFGTCFNTYFSDQVHISDLQEYQRTDGKKLQQFLRGLLLAGVRPTNRGTWFVSTAHDQSDLDETLVAVKSVLSNM